MEKYESAGCVKAVWRIPVVSVIVPVYNIDSYLTECLDSLLRQTLDNIEIICIDDGSKDCSAGILQVYAQKDARVRIYHQIHQGVSVARNQGIMYAKGKYILFMDGDDWIESDMLESMVREAERELADVVICSAKVDNEEIPPNGNAQLLSLQKALTVPSKILTLESQNIIRWKLLDMPGGWPFIWNKLIRRELLERHKLIFAPGLALGEDGIFLQTLYQYVNRIAMINPEFYHYRYFRADSATVKLQCNKKKRIENHLKVIEQLLFSWKARGLIKTNGKHLFEWIVNFLYGDYIYLESGEQAEIYEKFYSMVQSSDLLQFKNEMKKCEQKRFRNMISGWTGCSPIKKKKDIFEYKVQERIRKVMSLRE